MPSLNKSAISSTNNYIQGETNGPSDESNTSSSRYGSLISQPSSPKPQNNSRLNISSLLTAQSNEESSVTSNYSLAPPSSTDPPGSITDFYLRCIPTKKPNHTDKSTQTLPLNDNDTLFLSVLDENTVGKTKRIIYVDGQNVISINSPSSILKEIENPEKLYQTRPEFSENPQSVQESVDDLLGSNKGPHSPDVHNTNQYLPQRINSDTNVRPGIDQSHILNPSNVKPNNTIHQNYTSFQRQNDSHLQNSTHNGMIPNQINHNSSRESEIIGSDNRTSEAGPLFSHDINTQHTEYHSRSEKEEFQSHKDKLFMNKTFGDGKMPQSIMSPKGVSLNARTSSNELRFDFSNSKSYITSPSAFSSEMGLTSVNQSSDFFQVEAPTTRNSTKTNNTKQIIEAENLKGGSTQTPSSSQTTSKVSNEGKMFSCGKCPLSFRRNHDLKRHSRSHLPVRPYDCEVCMKSFSRKDALKRHRAANACKRFLRDMGSSQRETGDVDKLEVIQSNNDPIMPNTAKVEQSYDDKNNKNN